MARWAVRHAVLSGEVYSVRSLAMLAAALRLVRPLAPFVEASAAIAIIPTFIRLNMIDACADKRELDRRCLR